MATERTSRCAEVGHYWQDDPLVYVLRCLRCGATMPHAGLDGPEPPRWDNVMRPSDGITHALIREAIQAQLRGRATAPMTANLEYGSDDLYSSMQRLLAAAERTPNELHGRQYDYAFIDEVEPRQSFPPMCAPLDHEWITPPLGADEPECRHCCRTKKEIEDA